MLIPKDKIRAIKNILDNDLLPSQANIKQEQESDPWKGLLED